MTLAPGAGHGDEGDVSFQGPAQETDQAQALPAQPKPTHAEELTHAETATSDDAASPIIALATRRSKKPAAADATAVPRAAEGLVTVRPKPEKRKNAKERAKEKYAKKNVEKNVEKNTKDGTTPDMTAKAKSKVANKADTKAKKRKAAQAA